MLDAIADVVDGAARTSRTIPRSRRRSASTRCRTGCRRRCPRSPTSPTSPTTCSTCTGPTCASPARSPATACWRGGWPSATCATRWSCSWAGITTSASPRLLPASCVTVDQPAAGLVTDLKQRGLLDDTLVIFGTEFGRTSFAQGALKGDYGRDHHGGNFSVWMAGGGVKGGVSLRRDRRLQLQHRQGSGPHPRLQRHHPADRSASITRS